MPIHDWSAVDANLFHDFHQAWTLGIRNALNAGLLPEGYCALVEQSAPAYEPDVLALQGRSRNGSPHPGSGGAVVTTEAPRARHVIQAASASPAVRGNRVAIRHGLGRVVCVIEVVSPGNKASRSALRSFVEKSFEFLDHGVHLLVVDLFPPNERRDPQGIHKAIWDEIEDSTFRLSPEQPFTLAAYVATQPRLAYVEPVGVGTSCRTCRRTSTSGRTSQCRWRRRTRRRMRAARSWSARSSRAGRRPRTRTDRVSYSCLSCPPRPQGEPPWT